jgi:pimeloyl-ACP methyl ester carboxylesterase
MAAKSDDVAFVINVSGGGVSISEQNIFAIGSQLLQQGYSAEEVHEIDDYRRVLWAYYGTGLGKTAVEGVAQQMSSRPWFKKLQFSTEISDVSKLDPGLRASMEAGLYDPVPVAERVKVPSLYIFGAKDSLNPLADSVSNLMIAYSRGANTRASFIVFPDAGHGLEPVTGDVECHSCMESQMNATHSWDVVPGFFERTIAWLNDVLAGR